MVNPNGITRRDWLAGTGASLATLAAASAAPLSAAARLAEPQELPSQSQAPPEPPESPEQIADRIRRMKWWREARFGMFIHWGSVQYTRPRRMGDGK